MFGFGKKRSHLPSATDINQMVAAAGDEVKDKWVNFNATMHFKADIPLSQQIDLFVQPLQEFFKTKYPALLLGSSEIFWLTTFTAIMESGTHSKAVVNAAVSDLRDKYAGR